MGSEAVVEAEAADWEMVMQVVQVAGERVGATLEVAARVGVVLAEVVWVEVLMAAWQAGVWGVGILEGVLVGLEVALAQESGVVVVQVVVASSE